MLMRSQKWFAVIVAISCFGVAERSWSDTTADISSANTAGGTAGSTALGVYGSSNASKTNVSLPMTNTGTQMKTIDGSQSFSGSLSSASTNKYLQLLVQPTSTGDIKIVAIGQDTQALGTFDNNFTVSSLVSGACANGFISCDPGTWSNCVPLMWQADSSGTLVQPSTPPNGLLDLSSCYCLNNSCANGNSGLWANLPVVLKDLGGGLVGAIHSKNAAVMITDVQNDSVSITYYGQLINKAQNSTSSVSSLSSVPTAPQAQAYYGNPGTLNGAAASIGFTQSSDPSSYYSLVTNSPAATKSQLRSCYIKRTGGLNSTTNSVSNTGTINICVDNNLYAMITQDSSTQYSMQMAGTGSGGLSQIGKNCGVGWQLVSSAILPPPDATSQWKLTAATFTTTTSGGGCNTGSLTLDAIANGTNVAVMSSTVCGAPGAQTVTANWSYLFQYTKEAYTETFQDTCDDGPAAPANDSTCRLRDETTDGIVTISNFNASGFSPLPNCQTYHSSIGLPDMTVCPPNGWWEKDRTYQCTKAAYDFSGVKTRVGTITPSVKDNGTTMTYTDTVQNSAGTWSVQNQSVALTNRQTSSDCEMACKVARPLIDTQVGVAGTNSNNRISNNTVNYFYLPCADGATCPSLAGDTVVTQCSCINEFDGAMSVLQIMRFAGSDNICSSGTPQQP
jgi:hypothetical protein